MSNSSQDSLFFEDDELIFAAEDTFSEGPDQEHWKVMVVDDEVEVHNVTKLALEDFTFEDKGLRFINVYSG